MKIKDVMTQDVFTLSPEATVKDVADKMKEFNVGAIPIVENNRPVGIITDRDIVLRTVSKNKNPADVKAFEIMSSDLVFGSPDMDVDDAAALMSRYQIRRLPVVDRDRLVGIVALGDLAAHPHLADEAGEALSDISTPVGPNIE